MDKCGKALAAAIPAGQHGVYSFSQANRHSTFVNNLKTVSSSLIRKEFGHELARWYCQPVFWSYSYCVISYGGTPLAVLRQYIEQQRALE